MWKSFLVVISCSKHSSFSNTISNFSPHCAAKHLVCKMLNPQVWVNPGQVTSLSQGQHRQSLWTVGESQTSQRESTQTWREHANSLHEDPGQMVDLNTGLSFCEATVLTVSMSTHLAIIKHNSRIVASVQCKSAALFSSKVSALSISFMTQALFFLF